MTAIIIGDTHFKVDNNVEVDMFIEKITELISEKKPDFVVLLGDTLDTHERIHTNPLNRAYKFIKNIRNLSRTFVLVGNHDMCLGKDIQIPLWNGTMKFSQDIKVGDELIGDDGYSCKVTSTCSGNSEMYLVEQMNGENYVINENHILSLKCLLHKSIVLNDIKNYWTVKWLDINTMKLKSRLFSVNSRDPKDNNLSYIKNTIESSKILAENFLNSIPDIDILDISVKDYLKIAKNMKDVLYGFNVNGIYWNKKKVLLDPYILGMWLNNGVGNSLSFTLVELQLINRLCEWAHKNNLEVSHSDHYSYHVHCIQVNNSSPAIGTLGSSCYSCNLCIKQYEVYGRSPSLACANSSEIQLLLDGDKEIFTYLSSGASKEQLYVLNNKKLLEHQLLKRKETEKQIYINIPTNYKHQFIQALEYYNLYNNKHIPHSYIINDCETRLQLLAGFIDTIEHKISDKRCIIITQNDKNVHMIEDIKYLSRSLGFVCYLSSKVGDNENSIKIIIISGKIEIIPTLLNIKKNTPTVINGIDRSIKIIPLGIDKYYGFEINNKTNRFLLKDFTVTHNCNNQQYLNDNHWLNAMKEWDNVTIVDTAIIEKINGNYFTFCPYVANGRFEEALNTLDNQWKDSVCIFAHQEFYGCKMGAFISVDGDKWDDEYPNIISGHIHLNQHPQNNIYYPGSSLSIAFGESNKNIIAYITFTESKTYDLEEIDLGLPKKKIVYVDIKEIDKFTIPDTVDKIKLTISGVYEDFKSFKDTTKYKELVNNGIKIIFKPKKIEVKHKKETLKHNIENSTGDFNIILKNLVDEQRNSYLSEIYELVFNNNKVNADDIIFM